MSIRLPRSFYQRDALTVAKELLGMRLVRHVDDTRLSGLIVETEAYLHDDEACHASRGMTPRTRPMFEEGGITYVYFIYGMYNCLNIVTDRESIGSAVLIRAIEPLEGINIMQQKRNRKKLTDLTTGPGKLAQALGITVHDNMIDVTAGNEISIEYETVPADRTIIETTRIGIQKAVDFPYRFYIKDNPFISVL